MYGIEVSPDFISTVTDAVLNDLFSSNAQGTIQIGGSTFTTLPKSGNAAIFPGVTDAQVQGFFLSLTGASSLPEPVPLTINGVQGVRYTINTPQGNFTLRSVSFSSAQTGAPWTIDIPGTVTGTSYNREIKFLRGGSQ